MKDIDLYNLIVKIAGLPYSEAGCNEPKNELWLEDRRNEDINPYFNQTASGVFLELYYGQPGKIWTPWGQWACWGSGSGCWGKIDNNEESPNCGTSPMNRLLDRLGAIEIIPQEHTDWGEFGPVYALTKVDDIALPLAKRYRNPELSYNLAKFAWKKFKEQANGTSDKE